MEYEIDNQNDKYSSSSSSSSSTSESFINQINNLKLKMSATSLSSPASNSNLNLNLNINTTNAPSNIHTPNTSNPNTTNNNNKQGMVMMPSNVNNNEQFNNNNSNVISNTNTPSTQNIYNHSSNNFNTTLPNSCSLIFSTAASFNINQNDTVFYSRESIHLLAKFLANNSEQSIFRGLYSYAPDNLAWLWSFIDFETPIDLSQVSVQEHYEPFEWCLQEPTLSQIDDELINRINKIFSDSPLVQYKYRENLMIADLYKFLEHVQKINLKYIAISLFNLYFPRFSIFMDDQIKPFLRPKILASNLPLIKELDIMIIRLIKTRYSNLNEYKHKILTGSSLPSYVRSLLSESNFQTNKLLIQTLTSSLNSMANVNKPANLQLNRCLTPVQTNQMTPTKYLNCNLNDLSIAQDEKNLYQTLSYLKQLQKSTKINNDLDHMDDETNNNANQDDQDQEQEELKNILASQAQFNQFNLRLAELASPNSNFFDQSYYANFGNAGVNYEDNRQQFLQQQQVNEYLRNANLLISSPQQQSSYTPISNQNIANKILINTPQTPSNLNPYLLDPSASLWSNNNLNQTQARLNHRFLNASITPPPSANLKNKLEINTDDHFTTLSPLGNTTGPQIDPLLLTPSSNVTNDDQFTKYFKSPAVFTPPVTKNYQVYQNQQHQHQQLQQQQQQNQQKMNDFNNFVGTSNLIQNNQNTNGFIGNLNSHAQSVKYFNDLNVKTNVNYLAQATKSPLAGTRSPVYSNLIANAHHTWCGRLPPKIYSISSLFSRKVFLGGLPWDVNQQYLLQLLHKYGSVKLEIPGKDLKHPRVSNMNKLQERSTPGYVYIIFDHETAVQRMLTDCRKEYKNGGEHYFYNIFIPANYNPNYNQLNYPNNTVNFMKRGKSKEVEVIPWNQDDTSYVPLKLKDLPPKIDPKSTIFVGALHGMLNAQGLGKVMTEIFGDVIHAGLDTDKYKYPIGSGRVTFKDRQSYVKAIKSKFVTIKANLDPTDPSPKFEKTIQIDPYLEDAKCSKCDAKSHYFCRNEFCLDYYCMQCWAFRHDMKNNGEHLPLSRQNKPTHG